MKYKFIVSRFDTIEKFNITSIYDSYWSARRSIQGRGNETNWVFGNKYPIQSKQSIQRMLNNCEHLHYTYTIATFTRFDGRVIATIDIAKF